MKMRDLRFLLPLISACIPPIPVVAESITLEPSRDNTIYEQSALSNGQGNYLFAGQTAGRNNNALRRALLQFDVADQVPPGAVIKSATLSLSMNRTIVGPQPMTVHKLTSDWGEGASDASGQEGRGTQAQTGDATWTDAFFPSQSWTNPGGDFVAAPSATENVAGGTTSSPISYSWSSAQLVTDVQGWIDSPETNFGWILLGNETETSTKRFYSREHAVANERPQLSISYSLPSPGWAGYPISEDEDSVDTGDWIGLIDISAAPWVYTYTLDAYIYAEEEAIDAQGGWIWIAR